MANISYENQISALLSAYQKAFLNNCDNNVNDVNNWAVHKKSNPEALVKCTIPFVGKDYFNQAKKLLVYASAENLTYYCKQNGIYDLLDLDANAENRHRFRFDSFYEAGEAGFFPNVHLAPMTNGCLATAVYYVAQKLHIDVPESPREFYETIAFGNYGKYSIKGKTNRDYAKDKERLAVSEPFIKIDLAVLQPDYIIMPKTICSTEYAWLEENKGKAKIIPISQINARVVNLHIARKFKGQASPQLAGSLYEWYNNVREVNRDNYRYVFAYLDSVLDSVMKV